jgi:hypothetical protein
MESNQQNNSNGLLKAALAIALLLSGFLGYLLYDAKQTNANQVVQINQKVEQLASVKTRLDSVSAQLDAKIAEITSLGGKVDELVAAKARLEKDKVALKNSNGYSAKQYDVKIQNYIALLAEKDTEIASLRAQNEQLTAKVEVLNQEKEVIIKEKEVVVQENTGLKTEKEKLTTTVQEYTDKNEELTKKVTIASALKAEAVKVYAVTPKGRIKDSGKYRAKKVDQLKFLFNLAPNAIAEQENKEILVRILDPEGAVVSDSATGSGLFQFAGKDLAFTTKSSVAYTNNNQAVEMVYARGMPYRSGRYNVELYSEGFKIGEGGFQIK